MGTITYMQQVDRASKVLRDGGFDRWTIEELLDWISDGEREVVRRRPDATAFNTDLTLVAGTRQRIPDDAYRLITLIRTINGGSIQLIDRKVIDAQNRDWHRATPADDIEYYIYDDRDPRTFYVYPPAKNNVQVEGAISVMPSPPVIVGGNEELLVGDEWAGPTLDWALFRAFSKDAESSPSHAQSAANHLNAFKTAMGEYTQADTSMSPNNGNA